MNERDRFDKFTERARKVLSLAQEEARRFQHNYIGTEHLLLGLVREGEGVAANVLINLGVELNTARSAVEFIVGRADRIVVGEIGLTPRSRKVIELAADEARRLNHHYIATEHLLLGLIREGEGIVAGVLGCLGVSLEKVRTQTVYVLSKPVSSRKDAFQELNSSQEDASPSPSTRGKGKKIMIICKNPTIIELIKYALKLEGASYMVVPVYDESQGRERIDAEQPDCVMLDSEKSQSGYQLLHALRC